MIIKLTFIKIEARPCVSQIFSSTIIQTGSNRLVLRGKFRAIFSMANSLNVSLEKKTKGDSINHPPPTPPFETYGIEGAGGEGEWAFACFSQCWN
jgi:hypothetical protein